MADQTPQSIYDFVLQEESSYQTRPVPIVDGYEWNMYRHVKLSTLYKNSQYDSGKEEDKPFRNIIRPILNVAYRSEGFNVKDIDVFVDDEKEYYKSFLTRRYHNRWARKNDLDNFIDDLVESYVDYGGVLVKNVNRIRPEVVPLQRLAFCDQTDILSGVICEKHMYTPDQLLEMKWDKDKIDEAIDMAAAEKAVSQSVNGQQKAKTPGKYIPVYELHGVMPTRWLTDKYEEDDEAIEQMSGSDYVRQAQYITFYTDSKGDKHGICLFKTREKEEIYKFLVRDKIYGRALGFGGIEELFEPQVWVNYSIIQQKEMLDVASLMILQTQDTAFKNRNKITDLEKGEILIHEPNAPITQVNIQPINMVDFEKSVAAWEQSARITGSATDPQLGIEPDSGTPFKLQDLVVQTGQGLHEFRQGKIATFLAEIYRDWLLGYLVTDMNKGNKWLEELSLDEMQDLAETIAVNLTNAFADEQIINKNRIVPQEALDAYKQTVIDSFMKGGSKKFLEIVKGELKDIPTDVYVNIAGKQKDLAKITDKLTNIFRQVISNPQVLANPGMAKIFNEILEASGLSPVDFSGIEKAAPVAPVDGNPPADNKAPVLPPPTQ